jgi:hypothetical protein
MALGFYSSGVLEYEQTKAWSSRSIRPIRKETNGIGISSTGPFSLLIAQQHMKPTGPATGPNRRPACIDVCVWHIYSVFIQIRWLPNHAISCRQVILRTETLWQLILSNCEFHNFSTAPALHLNHKNTGATGIQKDTHICPGVMMDLKYCLHQQHAWSHDAAFNYYNYYSRSMLDGSRQHFQHYNKPFSALPLLFLKSKRRIGLE